MSNKDLVQAVDQRSEKKTADEERYYPWALKAKKSSFTVESAYNDVDIGLSIVTLAHQFYAGVSYPRYPFALAYKSKFVFIGHHSPQGYYHYFDRAREMQSSYRSRGIAGEWKVNKKLTSNRELGLAVNLAFLENTWSKGLFVDGWLSFKPEWNFVRTGVSIGQSIKWNNGSYGIRFGYQRSMRTSLQKKDFEPWVLNYFSGRSLDQILLVQTLELAVCNLDVVAMAQITKIVGLQYYLFTNLGCVVERVEAALSVFHSSSHILEQDFNYAASLIIARTQLRILYHEYGWIKLGLYFIEKSEITSSDSYYKSKVNLGLAQKIRSKKHAIGFGVKAAYTWNIFDDSHAVVQSLDLLFNNGLVVGFGLQQILMYTLKSRLDLKYTVSIVFAREILSIASLAMDFDFTHTRVKIHSPLEYKIEYATKIRIYLAPVVLVFSSKFRFNQLTFRRSILNSVSFVYTF